MLKVSKLKCNGCFLMVLSMYQLIKLINKKFIQEYYRNIRIVLRKYVMINWLYFIKE